MIKLDVVSCSTYMSTEELERLGEGHLINIGKYNLRDVMIMSGDSEVARGVLVSVGDDVYISVEHVNM